jgi:hypothetical protein
MVVATVASSGTLTHTESQRHSNPRRRYNTSRSAKTRSPTGPADSTGCIKSFRLPEQAQVSRVSFQAQYQAFVRSAVKAAQLCKAIALNWTCVSEPFTRGGLSL